MRYPISLSLILIVCVISGAHAQDGPLFNKEIEFSDMTSAENTAARREAMRRQYEALTFCADPGNMPLSNNRGEGLQNRIAKAVTEKMGASLKYFWRPFFERGLTRETFDNKECEIIIEVPFGYERILTSMPIYRSSYVFATREDAGFEVESFEDPDLREKRVGVFQHSGMREALSRHGVKEGLDLHVLSYDADLNPEKQPWRQVQKVVDGELDIAGVWGPFAGWVAAKGAPITMTPANLMEDNVVLEFDLAYGVRTNDVVLKFALDFAILDARDEIEAILKDFGVPLVECAACAVSGDLPAHGTYFGDIIERTRERFVTRVPEEHRTLDTAKATPDQIMTLERVERALADGANPQAEMEGALIASDETRVAFLLERGAAVDRPDAMGTPPVVAAARNRDVEMLALLGERGADFEATDAAGNRALHHAVLRNHVPTVEFLLARGADPAAPGYRGLTPLALAIGEGMRWAAMTLIEAGAPVNQRFGEAGLTPLMALATQDESQTRALRVTGGPSVVALAEALIERGADVNATTRFGVTALMIAAGGEHNDMLAFLIKAGADPSMTNEDGRTALDIAEVSRSTRAAQALRILVPQRKARSK
ncbi:MAG: quinoprotein dehydrogenase-associated putative ABC transporter substrate-binding protein [Pseudomonadota bacterium]